MLIMSAFSKMLGRRPHLTFPKERNNTAPSFFEDPDNVRLFENVEQKASPNLSEGEEQHTALAFLRH
jgi:hypothetical protein